MGASLVQLLPVPFPLRYSAYHLMMRLPATIYSMQSQVGPITDVHVRPRSLSIMISSAALEGMDPGIGLSPRLLPLHGNASAP